MARTRNEQHAENRRAQILDAAARCFVRHGLHQTGMREIVAEADLSAGAVYNYFASKDAIILAIAARERQDIAELARFLETSRDTRWAIAQAVEAIIADCSADDARLSIEILAEASRNETVSAVVRENDHAIRAAFRTALSRGQQAGQVDTGLSTDQHVDAIAAIYEGFIGRVAADSTADQRKLATTGALIVDRILTPSGADPVDG